MKIQHQNFWHTTFVLRGNFIALNSDFKKEETLKNNDLYLSWKSVSRSKLNSKVEGNF